jgi:hypothetical protein
MTYPSQFTEFFGPCAWKFLHAVSFTYPENPTELDKERYREFYSLLMHVIPCPGCRMSYAQKWNTYPIQLESREALSKWVYDIHDKVNTSVGKKSPPFSEVKRLYADYAHGIMPAIQNKSNKTQRYILADPYATADGKNSLVPIYDRGSVLNDTPSTAWIIIIALVTLLVAAIVGLLAYNIYSKNKNRKKK